MNHFHWQHWQAKHFYVVTFPRISEEAPTDDFSFELINLHVFVIKCIENNFSCPWNAYCTQSCCYKIILMLTLACNKKTKPLRFTMTDPSQSIQINTLLYSTCLFSPDWKDLISNLTGEAILFHALPRSRRNPFPQPPPFCGENPRWHLHYLVTLEELSIMWHIDVLEVRYMMMCVLSTKLECEREIFCHINTELYLSVRCTSADEPTKGSVTLKIRCVCLGVFESVSERTCVKEADERIMPSSQNRFTVRQSNEQHWGCKNNSLFRSV